jgi:hypothetical protein
MIITSILTLIGLCGTLAIIAYLRQVEDAMAELQEELQTPFCPVCQKPHETKMQRSWAPSGCMTGAGKPCIPN